ncbi:M24 family metallopeptidase [Rhizobium rhizogenes]|jgi:Xaa-Pro aminopeptidase|uniref:M24 family metallopeptidase n=1 Tax=Rhizobium rhizogenes TaxID=359 RepID=UPI001572E92E|nr:Xaa-Pro peptidase family protein [Rhizobium rhizogenes]NTG45297.1 aminopeptidase P family protein [Rhizobium rhizogenes]
MLLNRQRMKAHMISLDLDAVVATSAENVTYLSGFWALPQWIRPGPQTYVVWPASEPRGKSTVITSTATLDLVADQVVHVANIRRYGAFSVETGTLALDAVSARHRELHQLTDDVSPINALIVEIETLGMTRSRIGLDESGLLPGYLDQIRAQLPHVDWVPAAEMLRSVRAVKTVDEIANLRRVAEIAESAVNSALEHARAGISEIEMARMFHSSTVLDDATPVLGCIGFGERSALMNVQPSERKLRAGDVIRFDVGGRYKHYRADIARIATCGEPDKTVSDQYRALLAGVEHAASVVKPGMPASQVFQDVMSVVRLAGLPHYKRNHVGHGIGMDGYDLPILSAASTDIIEEGMVLCIETPYYEIGRWGLQVEDMFVVRAAGLERLTNAGQMRTIEP